jgi:hypothetical protein
MTQGKIEHYHRFMKSQILLENYYLPGQLEQRLAEFVKLLQPAALPRESQQFDPCRCLLRSGSVHSDTEGKHQAQTH